MKNPKSTRVWVVVSGTVSSATSKPTKRYAGNGTIWCARISPLVGEGRGCKVGNLIVNARSLLDSLRTVVVREVLYCRTSRSAVGKKSSRELAGGLALRRR
jgi:hypothetical protein